MEFTKRRFVIVEGTRAGALKENVLKWLKDCRYENPWLTMNEKNMKIVSTPEGDVYVQGVCDLSNRDAYILQEMGGEAWRDLAALCMAA